MITRDVQRAIAGADFTDDCLVAIWLRKRATKLTITEAKAFRSELDAAIAEAERGAEELYRVGEPAAFDLHTAAHHVGQAVVGRLRRESAR